MSVALGRMWEPPMMLRANLHRMPRASTHRWSGGWWKIAASERRRRKPVGRIPRGAAQVGRTLSMLTVGVRVQTEGAAATPRPATGTGTVGTPPFKLCCHHGVPSPCHRPHLSAACCTVPGQCRPQCGAPRADHVPRSLRQVCCRHHRDLGARLPPPPYPLPVLQLWPVPEVCYHPLLLRVQRHLLLCLQLGAARRRQLL